MSCQAALPAFNPCVVAATQVRRQSLTSAKVAPRHTGASLTVQHQAKLVAAVAPAAVHTLLLHGGGALRPSRRAVRHKSAAVQEGALELLLQRVTP